jgi:murein DD-endopeptidase MepM/ murein hydrolase activator NlpD
MLLPEEGGESRGFRLSGRGLRVVGILALLAFIACGVMAGSWWFLALEAAKGWRAQAMVDSLEEENARVLALARRLEEVEEGYQRIRDLFGSGVEPVAPDLWLPPTGLPGTRRVGERAGAGEDRPTAWPLTEAGFVTQFLEEVQVGEDHPGVDIAIPTDSYVRAAGAGRVLRTGDDPVYGLFLVLDHGNGYQTVYAHSSEVFVERGQEVRKGEVIALTGSTGRSTAPHLHFEVLLDGVPVDPLSMVEQPG